MDNATCALCNGRTAEVHSAYPGYRAPATFAIRRCESCDVSFSDPLRSNGDVYELIYGQAALIPGYDRYDTYVRRVLKEDAPLDFLAASEEPYWALRHAIAAFPRGSKVLDIGSGLGYVTYALVRAGYDAMGLDISENAVLRARERFGDHYVAADLFEWSRKHAERYDVVVMLELIEHVENPREWVRAALRMVKPGGILLMTTPNKAYYVEGTVWETDAPPVHLWWFSPRSINHLVGDDATLHFIDFRTCELAPAVAYSTSVMSTRRSPMLNANGGPMSPIRVLLHRIGLLPLAKLMYARLHAPRKKNALHPAGQRETLAVRVSRNR